MSFLAWEQIDQCKRTKRPQVDFQILGNLIYDSEKKDSFSRVQDDWFSIWKKTIMDTICNKLILND